GSHNQLF
ncbi:hypothetical protein CFOL_v3_12472, partial [Cephalotus follicularis]